MKINNFQGDLTNNSAKKEALVCKGAYSSQQGWCQRVRCVYHSHVHPGEQLALGKPGPRWRCLLPQHEPPCNWRLTSDSRSSTLTRPRKCGSTRAQPYWAFYNPSRICYCPSPLPTRDARGGEHYSSKLVVCILDNMLVRSPHKLFICTSMQAQSSWAFENPSCVCYCPSP